MEMRDSISYNQPRTWHKRAKVQITKPQKLANDLHLLTPKHYGFQSYIYLKDRHMILE